ncbi:MAG: NAD(P)-dependent alcohol dehydrogenase [Planctomycetota bacterium]|nr:MAG: NAD(P)-dependent alcohol dehydrogenase [Planctomycetota bacterium]REJ93448.1 MAG: NAD(P)-dependent alcohol dehydrogenase [Planctomycetota bacterium]
MGVAYRLGKRGRTLRKAPGQVNANCTPLARSSLDFRTSKHRTTTMRCYTVNGQGLDQLTLAERSDPKPGPREVVVDVHAVSLNYRDLMVADGRYGGPQDPAIIATSDMAGVVAEIGPEVSELQVGDRVLNAPFRHWPAGTLRRDWSKTFVGGQGLDGMLAEQVVYPADALVAVPEHLSFAEAATLPVAGLTAWAAVVTHGQTQPGEWVLIHGTGGVAIFAMQLGQLIGARSIVTTSSPSKADRVRSEYGVAATVDYCEPDWPRQVREITGGAGVDVVVEVAGGESLSGSMAAAAYGARIALIGVLAGSEAKIDVFSALMRQITVRGIYMESTEELRRFAAASSASGLRPVVDRVFPFDAAREAYEHLASGGHLGKVCIQVR